LIMFIPFFVVYVRRFLKPKIVFCGSEYALNYEYALIYEVCIKLRVCKYALNYELKLWAEV